MSLLPNRVHVWSGPWGVPGGTEQWEHRSYRPRRLLEAVLVVAVSFVAAPWVWTAAADIAMLAGCFIFMVAITRRPRRRRRLRHPLADGLIIGGLIGWLAGRRRRS